MSSEPTIHSSPDEVAELKARLDEAEDTLRALRSGEVDALVIGDHIYTLESADAQSNRFRGEVLGQVTDVVIAVNDQFHVTYLNPAAERQYGITASEVLGLHLDNLYRYEWLDKEEEARSWKELTEKGFWRGENLHTRRDGERFWVESTVTRLSGRDGVPDGYLAVIRDVTARKNVEEALQKAHDELELRVAERTRELAEANASLRNETEERLRSEHERGQLLQRLVTSQESERKRIALDIHDQLGQRVTALRFQIASLASELTEDGRYTAQYRSLEELAKRLDNEVSFLAWELRPASLEDLGLAGAAKSFLDEWSRHNNIAVDYNDGNMDGVRIEADTEMHVYRIIQEALNNIAKHASASFVNVLLRSTGSDLVLIIEDDGKGFDPASPAKGRRKQKGLGLTGMKERAALVGGILEVESEPNAGTTVHARLPLIRTEKHELATANQENRR